MNHEQTVNQIYYAMRDAIGQRKPWHRVHAEIFGVHGLIRSLLRGEELADYQATDAYRDLLARLADWRGRSWQSSPVTRVVTVRLPASLHETLRVEAFEHRTSGNQLWISKLLLPIETELVARLRREGVSRLRRTLAVGETEDQPLPNGGTDDGK